jgi:ATP-binding protein involved in chromosome partitioning
MLMAELTRDQVESVLRQWTEPYLGQDLLTAKAIKDIRIDAGRVALEVELGFPAAGYRDELAQRLTELIRAQTSATGVDVHIGWTIASRVVQTQLKPLNNIKNIIAVASGKGGVGKSTTAVNLALALTAEGASAGVLDADIYGPSQPRMLGVSGRPESADGKKLTPMENYGVQVMSIGFLIDEEQPMIWRGPMVTQALTQLLNETAWRDLDYLVIDLPPGTGDIQLTLSQKIPVTGAVIVTTPQDIALLDARKGLRMFEKVNVPTLGIVENMSTHICSNCGHEEHIFGEGGGARMAEQYTIDLLGALPLDIRIRQQADEGRPTVVAEPDSPIARTYRDIARKVAAKLSLKPKSFAGRFPEIMVHKS